MSAGPGVGGKRVIPIKDSKIKEVTEVRPEVNEPDNRHSTEHQQSRGGGLEGLLKLPPSVRSGGKGDPHTDAPVKKVGS